MKLLILGMGGRLNEPESKPEFHMYLASLKKNVIEGFPEAKVLLFTSCNSKDVLVGQVKEYGLDSNVDVMLLSDFGLSEKTQEALTGLGWYTRVPFMMQVMFDYAERQKFYDADWVIHTDTDSEFKSEFASKFIAINELSKHYSKLVVSFAGDAMPDHLDYNGTMYRFEHPPRLNIYKKEEYTIDELSDSTKYVIKTQDWWGNKPKPGDTPRPPVYCTKQQKIRNDFFAMSKGAVDFAMLHKDLYFNWVMMRYNELEDVHPDIRDIVEKYKGIKIAIFSDKGTTIDFLLHIFSEFNDLRLNSTDCVMQHHGGAWSKEGVYLRDECYKVLIEKFMEYEHIWKKDFETGK